MESHPHRGAGHRSRDGRAGGARSACPRPRRLPRRLPRWPTTACLTDGRRRCRHDSDSRDCDDHRTSTGCVARHLCRSQRRRRGCSRRLGAAVTSVPRPRRGQRARTRADRSSRSRAWHADPVDRSQGRHRRAGAGGQFGRGASGSTPTHPARRRRCGAVDGRTDAHRCAGVFGWPDSLDRRIAVSCRR